MTSPNMFSSATHVTQFQRKIGAFPFLSRYLALSLRKRLETDDWYENRIIRYILKDSPWIGKLEVTFQEAQVATVHNLDEIFSVLQGTELDYVTSNCLMRWQKSDSVSGLGRTASQVSKSSRQSPGI